LSSAVEIHTSVGCGWIGNLNPAGITPTMVKRELLKGDHRGVAGRHPRCAPLAS
jgi:hypothetical protein